MENPGYTTILSDAADDLEMRLYDEDISSDDLVDYLTNAFRPFSEAINYFLSNYTDFSGNLESINERKEYLYGKYKDIGYSINPANIKNWLTNVAPSYTDDSKEKIYALCFALGFNVTITKEFFKKAYFDRCFDCHNINEAIYYFCIKNGLTYSHAQELITKTKSESVPIPDEFMTENILYTHAIQQRIDNIKSDDELLNYLKDNAAGFRLKRASSKRIFYNLLSAIQGTRNDAKLISDNPNVVYDYSNNRPIKALTVLEYYKYNTDANPLLQIYSDEFLINQILDNRQHEKSFGKNIPLPSALKSSFPNKHVLNDLRLGFEGKKPFKNDALRKTLIILFFYKYWCEQELNISPIEEALRYSSFIEEINDCLNTCGFESLYIGNPYDWIFIFSSKCVTPSPLDTFRDIYEALTCACTKE